MVQDRFNITQAEAVKWFEDNFGLDKKKTKQKQNTVKDKWN